MFGTKSGPEGCTPRSLGAAEIKGRFDPPPPLPWHIRHPHWGTLLAFAVVVGMMLAVVLITKGWT
jgi:hypothetical protein